MKLTPAEIQKSFGGLPPILDVQQVAALLRVPAKTVYDWSSRGRLDSCARRRGKRLLIVRDKLIEEVFCGKDW